MFQCQALKVGPERASFAELSLLGPQRRLGDLASRIAWGNTFE